MSNSLSVMLVDDSAVIRGALTRMIKNDPIIDIVASVSNGERAIATAAERKPDIAILDVEMPVMDGITALPDILKASPKTKVIMFSTLTAKGADVTIKALSLGAVECLVKPSSRETQSDQFKNHLLKLLKSLYPQKTAPTAGRSIANDVTTQTSSVKPSLLSMPFKLHNDSFAYTGRPGLIAIGSSTGGPNALFEVCQHLKNSPCPIIITQHMPPTFTKILAQHITDKTGLPTVEGEEGMPLENGKAYVAPGGKHMIFKREAMQTTIHLDDGPQVNFCKPAVDPMFKSALNLYGNKVLGIILTGMGSDGLGGAKDLVAQHGRVIAQDEATSTVWGMPRAVALAGICNQVLPLKEIGPWVKRQCE